MNYLTRTNTAVERGFPYLKKRHNPHLLGHQIFSTEKKNYVSPIFPNFPFKKILPFSRQAFTVALPALGVVFIFIVIFVYLNTRPKNTI